MIEKYLDQGYHCIPCLRSSKKSALKAGYSTIEYGEKGITVEQAESWDKEFPIRSGYGIALLCGTASNTIALDIDSNDAELGKLLPESPCVKKGQTGETRFFKYSASFSRTITIGPEIKLPKGTKDQVEILSNGKYTLLPPSVHEDTKQPYIWIGEDQLVYLLPVDLPELDGGVVDIIRNYYARKYGYDKTEKKKIELSGHFPPELDRVAHGAYNRIKTISATLIGQDLPIDVGIEKLLDYDKQAHGDSLNYFSDKTRGIDSAADEESNALRFYANMLHTINRERKKRGESPHRFLYRLNQPAPKPLPISEARKEYPKARGFMRDFQKYCELMSNGKTDALSLGGAISVMSILCANRYRTQAVQYDVRPNLYVINLAKSGSGKECPQNLVKDLLKDSDTLGANSYRSGTSIIQGLPDQQERLSVMNECASFLKDIAQGEGFQQEMNDILSNLFSCVHTEFSGISSVGSGDKFGACYNPSISIFGSTTMFGFRTSVNQSMGTKGLMPRFLTFWQYNLGSRRWPTSTDIKKAEDVLKDMQLFVKNVFAVKKRISKDYVPPPIIEDGESPVAHRGKKYDPFLVPMTDEATDRFKSYAEKFFPSDTQEESFEDAFRNRFAELAVKCALLDAVSLGLDEIGKDSMEWGIAVVDACWDNIRGVYEQTSASNAIEKNSLKVLEVIKESPGISLTDLSRKTRGITGKQRSEILKDLEDAKYIQVQPCNTKTKKQMLYYLA
jgi:hypothetical protein